jgi:hypothetical protein
MRVFWILLGILHPAAEAPATLMLHAMMPIDLQQAMPALMIFPQFARVP